MPAKDEVRIRVLTETKKAVKDIATFAAGITGAIMAVKGMARAVGDMMVAYAVQEQAEARLAQAVKSTGMAAGLTAFELETMASGLQKVTKFGDETIMGAQSLLLTFTKIGKDIFPEATEAILNISEAMGQDLRSTTVQLGKALNDPILGMTALRRVGIQLSTQQEDLIRSFMDVGDVAAAQKVILGELETQFGGMARAVGDTASGSMVQLQNALGDLKEEGGKAISLFLAPFAKKLTEMAQDAKVFLGAMSDVSDIMGVGGFAEATEDISAAQEALVALNIEIERLQTAQTSGMRTAGRSRKETDEYINDLLIARGAIQRELVMLKFKEGDLARELTDAEKILLENAEFKAGFAETYEKTLQGQIEAKERQIRAEEDIIARFGLTVDLNDEVRKHVFAVLNMRYDELDVLKDKLGMQVKSNEIVGETVNLQVTRGVLLAQQRVERENSLILEDEMLMLIDEQTDALEKQKEVIEEIAFYEDERFKAAIDLAGQFFDIVQAGYQNWVDAADASYARARDNIESLIGNEEERAAAIALIDEELEQRKRELAREAWGWKTAAAVAEIAINTAVAIAKALTLGPIAGPIMAAVIAGLGVAQAGVVLAQPVPMAAGGIVTGPTNILAGEAGPEAIIPLGRGGGIGGTSVVVHVHGTLIHERDLENVIYGVVEGKRRGY